VRAWTKRLWLALPLVVACGSVAPVGPFEGLRGPGFVAPLTDGGAVGLADLRGKPVVLVFWASWCGPCRYEVPHVNLLHQGVGDTAHVLGINAGEDPTTVAEAMRALDIRYPVVLDGDGSIVKKYHASALPLVVVLDPEGRVRFRGNTWPSRINALVAGLAEGGGR